MTGALSIGISSLNADRTAIQTTSENVANAQTPGYVREAAHMAALPGGDIFGVGDGVEVTSVVQATNALLSANNWQAQGALARLSSLQQTLSAVENVFPLATQPAGATASGTSATSSASISGQLATFWSSWDAIAQSPASLAPRSQVVDEAQSLVVSLHEAAAQLDQIKANVGKQLTDQVSQVNTLLGQVASLNQSIVTTKGAGGNPNQLQDQLRSVIGTLSQLAGVVVRTQANGSVTVALGGVTVVQGDTVTPVALQTSGTPTGPTATVSLVTASSAIPVGVSGGSIAGLLSAANQYIPGYQTKLNDVATALATTVNGQLAKGLTATGASGATYPLFTTGTTAAGIEVNPVVVADPTLIAASSSPATPATPTTLTAALNNGANAQAMADLGTTKSGPDAAYQTLVQGMGADTQGVDNQVTAQTAVAAQAQQALQSASGVNLDQELTNLLGYQQNYQASAKVLTTVDATIQSLLQAV